MLLNDRYEYNPDIDLIGKGGLAEVFKAYDRQRACYVALKKFNAADSLKYGIKEEFQKSIHFAHGNIVRAFDFFTVVRRFEDGDTHETQYGVMELVEGGDLADYLKKKPAQEELLEVVKGILRGLDYLHTPDPTTNKRRIIHRDIKPGNILIFYNDEGKPIPKIADFNVAKEVSSNLESSVSMVGTYEYMAPEQLNVTKHGIDNHVHANADLWALGVILCDYFMGKSLFGKRSEGNTQGQIIGKILDEPIPAEAIRKLPAPFNGIIARCLVRSAKDRAQGAKELLEYISTIEKLETTVVEEGSGGGVEIGKLDTTVIGSSNLGGVEVKKSKAEPRTKDNIGQYFFAIAAVVVVVVFVFIMLYKSQVTDTEVSNAGNEGVITETDSMANQVGATTNSSNLSSSDNSDRLEKLLSEANAFFEDGNFKGAKEKTQEALKLQPDNSLAKSVLKKCDEQLKISKSLYPTNNNPLTQDKSSVSTNIGNDPFSNQMVLIQGGTFMMGSPSTEYGHWKDENQHRVTVSSFKMSKYEVTQVRWQSIMGNNPSYFKGCNNCSVENVSWNDIQEFLSQLNLKTGKKYRLPTEAEWEYAARGGTTTPFNTGTCLSTNLANYNGNVPYQSCSNGTFQFRTVSVGSFKPNKYGLYDMHGNVEEWCSDWYGENYYNNSLTNNPKGPLNGTDRVLRGGSWYSDENGCRSASRNRSYIDNRSNYIGFRLVADP